jgi:secondary thiamine-phosphate synthase enzyme
MPTPMPSIRVNTHQKTEFIEVTDRVAQALRDGGEHGSACLVYCPHTTAGLFINERADPAVAHDIRGFLDDLVPRDRPFTHAEGNSPAHVKASLIGSSVLVPIVDGGLALGTWQGIFLAEFDGPRERLIQLRILS